MAGGKLRAISAVRRRTGAVCLAALLGLSAPTAALAAKGSGPTATAASSSPTATAASSTAAVTPTAPSGSNPLSGGVNPVSPVPTTTTTTPTAVNTTATAGGSGVSTASALAIVVGALVLIGGISLYIWRDARRRAPVRTATASGPETRVPGSKRPPKARKLSPAERKRRKRGRAKR